MYIAKVLHRQNVLYILADERVHALKSNSVL